MLNKCFSLAGIVTAFALMAPAAAQPVTTFQGSPTHSGSVSQFTGFNLPLRKRWSVDLGGALTYPVIANGLVFINAGGQTTGSSPPYGSRLFALSFYTGKILWERAFTHTYFNTLSTFDSDILFTVDPFGTVYALNPRTGSTIWSMKLPGNDFVERAPVARNGILYINASGDGSTLYAIKEHDGTLLWQANTNGGDGPTLSSDGAFLANACNTYEFDLANGALRWTVNQQCSGGLSIPGVFYDDQFFGLTSGTSANVTRDYDARTGATVADLSVGQFAMSQGSAAYTDQSGNLAAINVRTRARLWIQALTNSASAPPFIVNDHVLVSTSDGFGANALEIHSLVSGTLEQTIKLPKGTYFGYGLPPSGMAAVDGVVLVPQSGILSAF